MEAVLKDKIKRQLGLWGAFVDDRIHGDDSMSCVGATMIAGRSQVHLLKYGSVGVVDRWRRQRIGTALYVAMTAQGILEGRRLFEDTIVGDNDVQFLALPQMGITVSGELRHRTGSAKSIFLFQKSLIDADAWASMLERLPADVQIEVRENSYTDEVFAKNADLARAHALTSHLPERFAGWIEAMKMDPRFKVVRGGDFVKAHKPLPAGRAPGVPAEQHHG